MYLQLAINNRYLLGISALHKKKKKFLLFLYIARTLWIDPIYIVSNVLQKVVDMVAHKPEDT